MSDAPRPGSGRTTEIGDDGLFHTYTRSPGSEGESRANVDFLSMCRGPKIDLCCLPLNQRIAEKIRQEIKTYGGC